MYIVAAFWLLLSFIVMLYHYKLPTPYCLSFSYNRKMLQRYSESILFYLVLKVVNHHLVMNIALSLRIQYLELEMDYPVYLLELNDVIVEVTEVLIRFSRDSVVVYLMLKSSTTSVKDIPLVSCFQRPGVNLTGLYPNPNIYCTRSSCANLPACSKPYIPPCTSAYTYPSKCTNLSKSYCYIKAGGKRVKGILMYLYSNKAAIRKKSFKLIVQYLVLLV